MIKRSLLLVSLAFLLGGCQGYLDKNPDAALDISIDTEEKLQELLTGAYPTASYIPFPRMFWAMAYCSSRMRRISEIGRAHV